MNRIAVVTATRAEYGLLSPVIKELRKKERETLIVELIVTGTHLSQEYGMTVDEIDDRIDHRITISVKSENEQDISNNQAEVLVKFTELFIKEKYNAVMLLGDRYETLAIAIAAGNTRTPIFHLCGGDTTEGAIDEWVRHSISKMSYLHFVTNEESRRRVIQLGENPERVFNYGSTSIDNVLNSADMSKSEALKSIGIGNDVCKYALCTYHPVTMENSNVNELINEFIKAIQYFGDIQFIVTKSNADQGGAMINRLLEDAAESISNMHVYSSLGVKRYLSLMKHSEFVIGNSSSGIIEAPAFHIPTVNIGDRQRGRLQTKSVINCKSDAQSIIEAINMAISKAHINLCESLISPYGDGKAATRIAEKSIEVVRNNRIYLKKTFYNI